MCGISCKQLHALLNYQQQFQGDTFYTLGFDSNAVNCVVAAADVMMMMMKMMTLLLQR